MLYASFLFLSELLHFLSSELFQMGPDGDQRGDIIEYVMADPVWSGLAWPAWAREPLSAHTTNTVTLTSTALVCSVQ